MRSKRGILILFILLLAAFAYLAIIDMPAPTSPMEREIPREELLDTP